jgi:hypothetical protein
MPEDTLTHSRAKYAMISRLSEDFVSLARSYGRTIVQELCLPASVRTVARVDIGGHAGGEKFIVGGILFKLAKDVQTGGAYIYGGERPDQESANKAAGNELGGATTYFNYQNYSDNNPTAAAGLCVPMTALVDFRGYRLLAIALLPLEHRAKPIYGSNDGGKHVYADVPAFNGAMESAAKYLHLKAHMVGGRLLHSAGDVEGHLGQDGRYYLLDLGRTRPPESPLICSHLPHSQQSIFSRLLRAEFLQYLRREKLSPALSPDSLSGWGECGARDHNADIHQATAILIHKVLPEFARWLGGQSVHTLQHIRLTEELHIRGINIRHCGLVRARLLDGSYTGAYETHEDTSEMISVTMGVTDHDEDEEGRAKEEDSKAPDMLSAKKGVQSRVDQITEKLRRYVAQHKKGRSAPKGTQNIDETNSDTTADTTTNHTAYSSGSSSSRGAAIEVADKLLLFEMVSRTLKNLLRNTLRAEIELQKASENAVIARTVSFLNLMCHSADTDGSGGMMMRDADKAFAPVEKKETVGKYERLATHQVLPSGDLFAQPFMSFGGEKYTGYPKSGGSHAEGSATSLNSPADESDSSGETSFWKAHVVPGVLARFGSVALVRGEAEHLFEKFQPYLLLSIQYVLRAVGFSLSATCLHECQSRPQGAYNVTFTSVDVVSTEARVKCMSVTDYSRGRLLLIDATYLAAQKEAAAAARLRALAIESFNSALMSDPMSVASRRELAFAQSEDAGERGDLELSDQVMLRQLHIVGTNNPRLRVSLLSRLLQGWQQRRKSGIRLSLFGAGTLARSCHHSTPQSRVGSLPSHLSSCADGCA